jgi:glycosyltransferase involved in cell wall biosynthesis
MVPKISVIIPTLNEEKYLPTTLRSLARQVGCELEVLVVDGKSDDSTQAVATRLASELVHPGFSVHLLESPRRNVAVQRNWGAKAATHELLLFLDADTAMPRPNLLADVVARFNRKRLKTATLRLKSLEQKKMADLYLAIFYGFTWIMQYLTPFASGAFILTTRDSFRQSGGFDDTICVNEDANFCKKSRKFGKFGVLSPFVYTSSRRFDKEGYAKSAWMYVRMGAVRLMKGEIRNPKEFDYPFGGFGEKKK